LRHPVVSQSMSTPHPYFDFAALGATLPARLQRPPFTPASAPSSSLQIRPALIPPKLSLDQSPTPDRQDDKIVAADINQFSSVKEDKWDSPTQSQGQSPLLFPDISAMETSTHESRSVARQSDRQRSRSCEFEVEFRDSGTQATESDPPRMNLLFSDASYAPPSFSGAANQDADRWLRRFRYYIDFRQMTDAAALQLFKLLLTDSAADWLESVPPRDKLSMKALLKAFKERFAASDIFRWQQASAIFARQQGAAEPVDTYITDVLNLAKKVPITDDNLIRFALIKGFKPSIRQHVLQSSATTLEGTLKAARVAEAAASQCGTDTTDVAMLSKDVRDLMAAFKDLHAKTRPATPERVANLDNSTRQSSARQSSPRRVTFEDQRRADSRPSDRRTPPPRRPVVNSPTNWDWPEPSSQWSPDRPAQRFRSQPSNFNRWQSVSTDYRRQPRQGNNWTPRNLSNSQFRGKQTNFYSSVYGLLCGSCGRNHAPNSDCFAKGLTCFNCGKLNHIKRMCRSNPVRSPIPRSPYPPPQ